RCQKNVAKLFRATGAVMNSAQVDAANRFYTLYKPVHARDVASQDKPGSRITGVFRVIADGGCDVDEANLHVRRDCHSIKLFLPVAGGDQIVDKNEQANVERLTPTDDNLAMNEAVIDAVKADAHQRPTTISDAFPRSAAARAASVGGTSVLNTKSSRVARFTPLTRTISGSSLTILSAAMLALPAGRSVKMTRAPVRSS